MSGLHPQHDARGSRATAHEALQSSWQPEEAGERPFAGLERSVLRSVAGLLSAQAISVPSTLISSILIPRLFGADDLGQYVALWVVAKLVEITAGLGIGPHVVRTAAREPSRTAELVVHSIVASLAVWGVLALVVLAGGSVVLADARAVTVLGILLLATACTLVMSCFYAGLQANHMLGRFAVWAAVVGLATQGASAVVLYLGGAMAGVAMVLLGASVATASIAGLLFWLRLGGEVRFQPATALGLARAGLPFLAWSLGLMVYGTIDQLLLAVLADSQAVGEYVFAYRIATLPLLGSAIITTAVYPALAVGRSDLEWFRGATVQAARAVLVPASLGAFAVAATAPHVTRLLGGGTEFAGAAPVVAILSAFFPLVAVHTLLGMVLFAEHLERPWAVVGWLAATFNTLGNLAAIPVANHLWGNGAIGAAGVTFLTECLMGVGLWRLGRHIIDYRALTHLGARVLACSLVMVVAVLITDPIVAFPGTLVIGVAVFAAATVALGLVRLGDVHFVLGSLRRSPTGATAATALEIPANATSS